LHDPIALAEQIAVLDQVTGGRIDIGIGRAQSTLEYRGFDIPYAESRARVDEGIAILRGAWTQEPFSYVGQFRRVPEISLTPKPLQQPHPPLYFACNSAETVPIAARHGLPMMASMLVRDEQLAERREVYREAARAAGHAPAEIEARLAETWSIRFVYVAEDARAAQADPREHLIGYQAAVGERARADQREDRHAAQSYEDRLAEGTAYFGTPDQVAEQIRTFREQSGVQNLLCFMSFNALDPEKALRSMTLFAHRVMPRFVG
jgi:alkanesulfonate monooxygenase SsuD/methylene tetrahydromethanopterin reductase-like flavin-dependent oxidoreductase (luciferase family)